jgi:hypothetical protein
MGQAAEYTPFYCCCPFVSQFSREQGCDTSIRDFFKLLLLQLQRTRQGSGVWYPDPWARCFMNISVTHVLLLASLIATRLNLFLLWVRPVTCKVPQSHQIPHLACQVTSQSCQKQLRPTIHMEVSCHVTRTDISFCDHEVHVHCWSACHCAFTEISEEQLVLRRAQHIHGLLFTSTAYCGLAFMWSVESLWNDKQSWCQPVYASLNWLSVDQWNGSTWVSAVTALVAAVAVFVLGQGGIQLSWLCLWFNMKKQPRNRNSRAGKSETSECCYDNLQHVRRWF